MKWSIMLIALVSMLLVSGCDMNNKSKYELNSPSLSESTQKVDLSHLSDEQLNEEAIATFAGGCFWCMEAALQEQPGVREVISGYTGGQDTNPTYKKVSSGKTGHKEAVQVFFNPNIISYSQLLKIFWTQIDPTDAGGQFADRGSQYQTAIFYHDQAQKATAKKSKSELAEKYDLPIATEILPAVEFYEAEDYHQDYYKKQSGQYKTYATLSGRKAQIKENEKFFEENELFEEEEEIVKTNASKSDEIPTDDELRKLLTPMQYKVTQTCSTEPAFNNKYWDEHRDGIYVDVVSGEPLFSSKDKFDSGSGWPSFTKPLNNDSIIKDEDTTLGMTRTEVKTESSHLGHVFNDGPKEAGGLRYCINSASLKFIPKEELEEQGYGDYLKIFE